MGAPIGKGSSRGSLSSESGFIPEAALKENRWVVLQDLKSQVVLGVGDAVLGLEVIKA